jgi:cytoskeletal protein CcmA (bactofilin family)
MQTGTSSRSKGDKRMATIGQSIIFKGELSGDEDLEIEGQVDGVVQLANHQLTVGANGRLKAAINAKSIIVIGQVIGDLTATERIEIQATGVVEGDLQSPRLNVQEGAVLNGSINMSSPAAAEGKKPNSNPANQSNPSAQSGSAPTPSGEALKTA